MNAYLEDIGMRARKSQFEIARLSTDDKNKALVSVADALIAHTDEILNENEKDVKISRDNLVKESLIDRLTLTKERIKDMAEGLIQISKLPDPINEELDEFSRPNGLSIHKVRVPIGVIGIIYESRPNVTADAFGLCFKASNVSILRGGKDAINSNKAIIEVIRNALSECGISKDSVILIENTDREIATEFMKMNKYVDLLIPRGGAGLIRSVVENATIPVIETGTGNCHVFVDESADVNMALDIIVNAKTQRMGVCNAIESLIVHENIAEKIVPLIFNKLNEKAVEIRACEKTISICPDLSLEKATEEDYATEYLGPLISLKIVKNVNEAIEHVNKYTTHHSECIVTENKENAEKFMNEVDAACVYVNASTRFTDGFEFGFGAEIGISTQKLHARGPMGLKELTSYKYKVYGNGQIRG